MLCVLGSYNNRLGVLELTCTILWLVLFIRTCWFAHRLEEKKMKLKKSNIHLVHSIQRVTWTPKRVIVCPAEIIAFKCGFEFAFVTSAKKKILLWPYWLYYYVVCRHFEEFVYSQILHSKAPQWAADFGPNNTRKNYHNDHLLPWFRIKSLIKYYFVTCICRLHALLYRKFVNEN